ncbi:hypothetical protein OIU78_029591 [Salix suchowensis]|nr:hypothetical protein OIU78_029591 [Salix suchowensis]
MVQPTPVLGNCLQHQQTELKLKPLRFILHEYKKQNMVRNNSTFQHSFTHFINFQTPILLIKSGNYRCIRTHTGSQIAGNHAIQKHRSTIQLPLLAIITNH